ncbi:LPXTG cell wall anchor domain-containing protein [Enterococcus hulanensis]|uniref:LPXTG cell wall anchor domain-containing protein n=1 Tax=Enterococcus hulanensis TaxID=2559929 RepID=UPI00288DC096|nr:LPXTG cell wall anchor domain-containing protein [Enterococcus hulanensis]MDT2661157.1 LPXTG cell wall anchor domain-containing protein [Enterococcus hulanensis]
MKKIVLLSLLVLSFPAMSFADTSDNVPESIIASSQEQVVESASIPDEATIDSKDTSQDVSLETQDSKEVVSKTQNPIAEEPTLPEEKSKDKAATESSAEKTKEIPTTVASKATVKEAAKVEKTQAVVEREALEEWTSDRIRESLNMHDYGISQAELGSYTDQELTNAFKLFVRYNFDFIGMDLGSYVRVLRMVYKDNLMSWDDVEQALAFNPHDYQTTTELAQNVDKLQMYLRVLHPDVRQFTNEELIYILNQMHGSEGKLSAATNLFSGILYRLTDYPELNLPIKNTLDSVPITQNLAATAKPEIQTLVVPKAPEKATVQPTAASQKEYPKTGEHNTLPITLAGIALFLISGILILKRRIRS